MWVKESAERIVLIGSILSIFDRLSETFIVNIIIVVLLNLFYSYTSKFFNGKEECDTSVKSFAFLQRILISVDLQL